MDSNQTRFQLLLGHDDWGGCFLEDGTPIFNFEAGMAPSFSWNPARAELTLGVRANVFHSAPGNQPPMLDQRRGAAQDRFGNFYWIADSGTEILVNSCGTSLSSHFWSSSDETFIGCQTVDGSFGVCQPQTQPAPLAFSGLAVTEQHYLIVGVLQPAGFLVFDLFHGGPPRQFGWPSSLPFAPFDMAPAPKGGVWILDRNNRLLWGLDRTFAVIRQGQPEIDLPQGPPEVFSPADGEPPPMRPPHNFPAGISLGMASPLGLIDAVAVAGLPDGSVLLLDSPPARQFSLIYRFRDGQQIGAPVSLASVLDLLAPDDRAGFSLLGYDFAFIASEQIPTGQRQNILYVVGQNGDQSWGFAVDYRTAQLSLAALAEFYPMRLFGGKGLVVGPSQVFYDSQALWVPLTIQRRPRYVDQATLLSKVFDGKEPDCVWHKLILEASIPSDTTVRVWSRAHNDPRFLAVQAWSPEPPPYMRGMDAIVDIAQQVETWSTEPKSCPGDHQTELPWTRTGAALRTWELAFQRASGQYLQLKLVLSGNGRVTPRVRALRAYYPRFSYLKNYLPSVYRQDQQSASFLDRYLANMEGFFTSIEDRIATVQALLDARSAPPDSLDWLANWFGVALDPSWTDAKRRLFLHNAASFFEARGTTAGLLMALRLTLEDCADQGIFDSQVNERTGLRIVEKFSTRRVPPGLLQGTLPQASASTGALPTQLKTAMWTPSQGADDLDQRYRDSLQLSPTAMYPISLASTDAQYSQWTSFSTSTLGFVPSSPDSSSDLWMMFLGGLYGVISALNSAYQSGYSSFSDVPFPSTLPRQPRALADWYQFQGILLIQAAAHQFTVFVPLLPADAQSTIAQRAKMSLAQRVIDLEKPAHSSYDIKFYWAFFRVGDARLGEDSVLDYGSRATQLLLPAVLGDAYVGSEYVTDHLPGDLRRRPFLQQRSC
jgi:phage tail-like protein